MHRSLRQLWPAWVASLAFYSAALFVLPLSADEPYGRHQFDDYEREHWSFMPVERPEVPSAQDDQAWIATPVDAFVLAELTEQGFRPSPAADRRTLLRRAYLDLMGLPPTLAEQQAFLADDSPDAFAKVVDDLLSRPQYGERWGRHWLDVVRYAESNGYERDNPKPHVWRYRDYVIQSFNEDKPYDQFIIEQLAGDELAHTNAQTQIATTFLRLGPWDDEPADPTIDRYDQLDDVLGTTTSAFLGLTIRCARCHDHKYEPFHQQDYARLLAIFEPLKRPQDGRTDLDRMVGTPDELASYRQTVSQIDEQVATLNQQCDELQGSMRQRLFESGQTELPEDAVAAFQTAPDARNEAQKKLVKDFAERLAAEIMAAASQQERENLQLWQAEAQQALSRKPTEPPRAYVWYEDSPQAEMARVFHRGDPYDPREEIAPGFPAVLVDAPPAEPIPTASSTGRRLQLAQWIASTDNPLTARVMVNRLWQHHFGDGIVATENDFGMMGEAPTNQELLDWLAAEFVASGWRIKPLHRLIMLSSTYQQAAAGNPALTGETAESKRTNPAIADPQARLLWRFPPRRLSAEVIRDSVLAVTGDLNLQQGGPSVQPKISEAVLATQSVPGNGWKPSSAEEANRRSVYVFVKRTLLVPELEVLDFPDTNQSCEQRTISTVAPQALTYMNGDFMQQQARQFAERLLTEVGVEPAAQIEQAFRLALCREVQQSERDAALAFLSAQSEQIHHDDPAADASRRALDAFCLVLLSTNEFFYLQ